MKTLNDQEQKQVTDALDALGVALADHNHQWTPEQRGLYDTAIVTVRLHKSDCAVHNAPALPVGVCDCAP